MVAYWTSDAKEHSVFNGSQEWEKNSSKFSFHDKGWTHDCIVDEKNNLAVALHHDDKVKEQDPLGLSVQLNVHEQ